MNQARWIAIAIFVCASMLNYLDRQLLAAVQPDLRAEFNMSLADFGWLISLFSIIYSVSAPLMGLFIDRVGLNWGITVSLGLWSVATIATGFSSSYKELIACRALLGIAQAGGVPGSGKAFAMYLAPAERALGNSLSQTGISIGGIAAPLLAAHYDWRTAFMIAGALGFFWIPIWWITSHYVSAAPVSASARSVSIKEILSDSRYWIFIAATILGMATYSLWTNWVTPYLVKTWSLTQAQANAQFAWITPLMGLFGGLTGGYLTLYWSRHGVPIQHARMRAIWIGCIGMLVTAAVPFMGSAGGAALLMAISYFCGTMFTVNLYSMPLEVFGRQRAAFAVASLTSAYGFMQTVISPLVGWTADHYGFAPVCQVVAFLPLCAAFLLSRVRVSEAV